MKILNDFNHKPWENELNFYRNKYKGYKYYILRVDWSGHLCGYVRIKNTQSIFESDMYNIQCHGGITYDREYFPREELVKSTSNRYIGFDCSHAGDFSPVYYRESYLYDKVLSAYEESRTPMFYRDVKFVRNECKKIIDQLIEMEQENEIQK